MPPREKIITFYLHLMVENVIEQINEENCKINQFKFEPLFINISIVFIFKDFYLNITGGEIMLFGF